MTEELAKAWADLNRHGQRLKGTTLSALFKDDLSRFQTLSFRHHDLLIDVSKEKIDVPAFAALTAAPSEGRHWRKSLSPKTVKTSNTAIKACCTLSTRISLS